MTETKEQAAARLSRGTVMVSASAGAGKTTVMIKRLADILSEGVDLDNVLCVTFTKKAAQSMKEKLRRELLERLAVTQGEAERRHIRIQLTKINSSDISTIDAFCAKLARTYFYCLDIEPSFGILADDNEAGELRQEAMESLFDRLYAEEDEKFYALLKFLRKKRSDKSLREAILKAYDAVRIHPDYEQYFTNCDKLFSEEGYSRVREALSQEVFFKCKQMVAAIEEFMPQFAKIEQRVGYFDLLDDMRGTLNGYVAAGDVFAAPQKLTALTKPRGKGEGDALFKSFNDKIKKEYKSICFFESEQTERERFFKSGEIASAFCAMLLQFDAEYAAVKRENDRLDYADLEQLCFKLLHGKEADKDVCAQIKTKYSYVFVDEYQDVNPIQDGILSLVSGGDVFFVGDVKQAIYGFRGSRSGYFMDKCQSLAEGESYIVLPDNFRSAKNVIAFVNKLFSLVMKKPVCAFDYTGGENSHTMRGGARYARGYNGEAKIVRFTAPKAEKVKAEGVYSVAGKKREAKRFTAEGLAALRIVERALSSTYYDPDDGKEKRVQVGDICVLTRKRSDRCAQGVVRALSSRYPVVASAEINICDRPEIARILDILSYIDNGMQDIPLASALLSPLGKMTEEELAAVRAFGGVGQEAPAFSKCVAAYAKSREDKISAKLKEFFREASRLKDLSKVVGAAKLIDEITRGGAFAAEFDSEVKRLFLKKLKSEAFGSDGELYLNAFLRKLKAGGYKIFAPSSVAADSIKVMTMHASKGLEFPVVIVADIAAKFGRDERVDVAFNEKFGFAPKYYGENRTYAETVLRKLYKMLRDDEDLNNEINLFYVACTRAKYYLYVLSSREEEYDPASALFANSYADLFNAEEFEPLLLHNEDSDEAGASPRAVNALNGESADEKTYKDLCTAAAFKYPYSLGVELPVKSSASKIIEETSENFDFVPLFTGEEGGAEVGTAYHRFLQLCSFEISDEEGVLQELDGFEKSGEISSDQRRLLNVEKLCTILEMPIFKKIRGRQIFREREFLCRISSAEYYELSGGAQGAEDYGCDVIVQGAIDLLAVDFSGGAAVSAEIVDYKFSSLSNAGMAQKYTPQLKLYKNAVCKIYGLPPQSVKATIVNIKLISEAPLSI